MPSLTKAVVAACTVMAAHAAFTPMSGACRADANGSVSGVHMTHFIKYQKTGSSFVVTDVDSCREICTNMTTNTTNNQTCFGIEYLITNGDIDYCEVWIVMIESAAAVSGNYTCEKFTTGSVDTVVSTGNSGNNSRNSSQNSTSGNSSSGNSTSENSPGTSSWTAGSTKFTATSADGNYTALSSNSSIEENLKATMKSAFASLDGVSESDITVAFKQGSIITEIDVAKMVPESLKNEAQNGVQDLVSSMLQAAGVCTAPCNTTVSVQVVADDTGSESGSTETSSAWRMAGAAPVISALLWMGVGA